MEGVATPRGQPASALAAELEGEGHAFDFYQAVALLELLHPDAAPVGQGSEPAREPVRFDSSVAFGFPPSDVVAIRGAAEPDRPASMTVSFLGLAGTHGPLPNGVTEIVQERLARKDGAFKAFLDIFNHRLVSLMYRARAASRVGLGYRPPPKVPMAGHLFSLMGLGTPRLRDRMGVDDRALLKYAGLLAGRVRSQSGLEILLAGYFRCRVAVRPYQGRWLPIAADDRTTLGRRGRNNRLGRDAVLGGKVWDHQGSFTVEVGPLTLAEYLDFLPVGRRHRPLVSLTRFYAGDELDFDIRLKLHPSEVVPARLGRRDGARLGWTSWLGHVPSDHNEVGEVRLAGRLDSHFRTEEAIP